ncbi:MAG: biopolymer transporter ExbD [Desulforhopalus sp.]
MKINIAKRRGPRIEMLPLIDIVFLLLVFFIYAMLSMAVHRALPIALPESATAEIDNRPQIAISISHEGSVYIDKRLVEPTDLSAILQSKTVTEKEKGVQVFADRLVEYQRLFMVLDSIKEAGISQISLQAERDG